MINQFENITYDSVKYIFNGEHHAIKTFLNLLNAVANDELDSPENELDDEVIYNYRMIRPLIEDFINETVYEEIYKNEMYDGLMKGLVDIFSCLHTVVYMRKHISDVDIQPKEVVYNYLQSFGFPAISEFNDYQKKEIARNVYGFLRRKGTPEIIKRILRQLGYPFFCISEFWLTKNSGEYIITPEIIDQFSNFKNADISWELLLRNKYFLLDEIRAIDPLWVISNEELNDQIENGVMTLPAKTAYFQFGVAASITDDERLVSSILYSMAKKNLYEYSINELTRDIRFPLFPKYKLSPLDLIYAYAILGYHYGKIRDIFGLNVKESSNKFDVEGTLKKFDRDMVFDTISKRSIYTASNPDNNNYHRVVTVKCIGWNGDITTTPIGEVMKEIRNLYDNTYSMIKYYPTRVKFNEVTGKLDIETPKTRYDERNAINEKYFISNALLGDIDDTLRDFGNYNPRFCEFVKEYINKYEFGSDEYIDKIYKFMFEIIVSLEGYIYSKSGIQFNMKQQFIATSKFNATTRLISNTFAPYHTKMLDAFYIHIIRELPYDQILISDTSPRYNGMDLTVEAKNYDPYWKIIYYKDGIYPDPRKFVGGYTTINNIKFYKSGGKYDSEDTKIVNGSIYNPFYSFSSDYTNTLSTSELYSGYKRKLAPHLVTTNTKLRFVVELKRDQNTNEITNINIYSKNGTDTLTDPLTILSRVPFERMEESRFIVEVQETYYDSYNDKEPFYRELPGSKQKRDINSTDDPRWNDRVDTIKISKFRSGTVSIDGYVFIGSVATADFTIDTNINMDNN